MTSRRPIQTRPTPTLASRFFKRAFTPDTLPYLGRVKSKRQRVRPPLQPVIPLEIPRDNDRREFLFSSNDRPFIRKREREREKSELSIIVFPFSLEFVSRTVEGIDWCVTGERERS